MLLRHVFTLALTLTSTTVLADSLDITLRDDSAQFQYGASMGRDTLGRSELHLGYLYTNHSTRMLDFGLLVQDEVGGNTKGINVGVGIKAVVANIDISGGNNIDSQAIAIGGLIRLTPFADSRFGLGGSIYMSPSILTYGDADRYMESMIKVDYEIIPQAVIYGGYRKIQLDHPNWTREALVDEGGVIGIKLSF